MKRFLKYIFLNKYALLIAAALLFFFSYVFNKYYTNFSSIPRETRELEMYIHQQQRDFHDHLADTALLAKLVAQKESLDEFKALEEKPYGLFLSGENENGNYQVIFWNTQLVLPYPEHYLLKDGEYFQKLANGYYVIEKHTLQLDAKGPPVIAFAMIPVQYDYFLETNYLPKEFVYSKTASLKISVSEKATNNPIHSITGRVLFFVSKKSFVAIPYNDRVTIALRVSGLFLLLIFFHLLAESVARRTRAWKGITLLAVCLLALRVTLYLLPSLLNLRQFNLFDPSIYGSNIIQRSLGDLLINAIIFCWVVVFAWTRIQHKKEIAINKNRKWRDIAGILALFFLILSTFLLANTIRSLVADSKISFDVTDFFSLSKYSVVGFIVLALLSLGYYYFTQILSRLIFPVFEKNPVVIYFVIGFSGLVYLTVRSSSSGIQFYLFVLAWLIIFTWLLSKQQVIFHKFRINIAGILFWIFVFSVSITAVIISENQKKEWTNRQNIAEKISVQNDESQKNLLNIGLAYLDNNFFARNFHRFYSPDSNRYLRDSIITQNYSGYLDRYDTKLYVFDELGRPLYNDDPTAFDDLYTIISNQSKPVPDAPGLYINETSFNRFRYISRRQVFDKADNFLGDVFIMSIPKQYGSETVFPQLFKQFNRDNPENSPVYSYALYSKGELMAASSRYPFVFSLAKNEIPKTEFEKRKNGDYDELWYRDSNEKIVVIARKKDSLIEFITLFSYIFCSFLFLVSVVQLISLVLKAGYNWQEFRRHLQMSIRTQVHSTIIFISLFSFIIIGVSTISFFISRYNRNNIDKLSRSMKVMVNEMQKKIKENAVFDDMVNIHDSVNFGGLQKLIDEVSEIQNVDVNVYATDGYLRVSSEANVYAGGILSKKMHPEAFYHLNRLRQVQHVQEEKMGSLSYLSIYAPVRNTDGKVSMYLNIPYFTSQEDLNQEISNFLVTIINLNAFIFLIAGVIALFITNRITRSFSLISEKMRDVNLGKMNEAIVWNRDDEIGELVKEYNKMVTKLEESAAALAKSEREGAWREMARQVAHEIKNPLTPMKLSIQYLQKAIVNNQPNVKELSANVASTLVEQIDHLSKIAADFSQFANIGNVTIEEVDLHDVLRSLKDLYRPNHEVEINWRPVDSRIVLKADKTQMNRLFTNLFANAIEACNGNGLCSIEVNELRYNGKIIVSIRDNGEGIPEEMQAKIFIPNFTTKSSGTGLGLAMCKGIVEQAKGRIWFETKVGEGTVFYVELPLAD
ncbi:MAG TPA: ATP-binding protein [Chitinophagaceae bacterium]|nr:ATP-binding protein [Chitinophagaceae bacterium]